MAEIEQAVGHSLQPWELPERQVLLETGKVRKVHWQMFGLTSQTNRRGFRNATKHQTKQYTVLLYDA